MVENLELAPVIRMNILAFFAHPDDETMLAGGIPALLARSGAGVHFVSVTCGRVAPLFTFHRWRSGRRRNPHSAAIPL